MKRIFVFAVMFSIALIMLNAQSISVTEPRAGDNWDFGDSKRITWTKSGEQNDLVKIRLFNEAGVRVLGITDSTDNDGLYEWTVPDTLPAGNYMILVRTVDNLVSDQSDFFNISEGFVSTGSIEIVTPNSSTSFYTTRTTQAITWNSIGDNHEQVSITVFSDGSPSSATTIAMSTSNDDSFSWNSPASFVGTGRFFVRVKTLDGAVWGDSGIFEILPTTPPPIIIDVLSPGEGANWNVGSPRMITWRVRGEMDDRVRIKLYDHTGSSLIRTIFDNTENDESEHWVVPGDHEAGRFVMKVITFDEEVTGTSEIFNITRPDDPAPSTPAPRSRNTIKIKLPKSSTVWSAGKTGNIVWAKNPAIHRNVKIELFKEGVLRPVKVITSRTNNDGTFDWKIPALIKSGRHIVKVTTLNNAAYGISEIFILKSKRIILRTKK